MSSMKDKMGVEQEKFPEAESAPTHAMAVSVPGTGTSAVIEQNGIAVHPQPTADPLDPLNWSKLQKHTILGIVIYFLFTYLTTTTVPSFAEIQTQYSISYSQVNWTVAIPALGLALGPLFWSSVADIYGRRIVFIIGTTIALVSTIGAAAADDYAGYMAARFFQGWGVSPGSSVGLAVVNDLFFDFERGQKLGLWVLAIDAGLLVGPIFGGFLNVVSAAWINWFNAILFGTLLLLELFCMPETLYPRTLMLKRMPREQLQLHSLSVSDVEHNNGTETEKPSAPTAEEDLPPRTKSLPFLTLSRVPSLPHRPIWTTPLQFLKTFTLPTIPLAVLGYSFLWYWWVLSVITMAGEEEWGC
ncbi:major facilitator superfamily domain-containing protein [Aspergillus filifer]